MKTTLAGKERQLPDRRQADGGWLRFLGTAASRSFTQQQATMLKCDAANPPMSSSKLQAVRQSSDHTLLVSTSSSHGVLLSQQLSPY